MCSNGCHPQDCDVTARGKPRGADQPEVYRRNAENTSSPSTDTPLDSSKPVPDSSEADGADQEQKPEEVPKPDPDAWIQVEKRHRQYSGKNKERSEPPSNPQPEPDQEELDFLFDEEMEQMAPRKNRFTDWSDEDSDYELDDTDVDKLLIVTQTPPYLRKHPAGDRTGNHESRAKITADLAKAINDGLYYYEQDLWKGEEQIEATKPLLGEEGGRRRRTSSSAGDESRQRRRNSNSGSKAAPKASPAQSLPSSSPTPSAAAASAPRQSPALGKEPAKEPAPKPTSTQAKKTDATNDKKKDAKK